MLRAWGANAGRPVSRRWGWYCLVQKSKLFFSSLSKSRGRRPRLLRFWGQTEPPGLPRHAPQGEEEKIPKFIGPRVYEVHTRPYEFREKDKLNR